jgi:hypothetical protein
VPSSSRFCSPCVSRAEAVLRSLAIVARSCAGAAPRGGRGGAGNGRVARAGWQRADSRSCDGRSRPPPAPGRAPAPCPRPPPRSRRPCRSTRSSTAASRRRTSRVPCRACRSTSRGPPATAARHASRACKDREARCASGALAMRRVAH